jgi:hypothetical protein
MIFILNIYYLIEMEADLKRKIIKNIYFNIMKQSIYKIIYKKKLCKPYGSLNEFTKKHNNTFRSGGIFNF